MAYLKPDIKGLIHSPAKVGDLSIQMVETIRQDNGGGVTFGLPQVDGVKKLLPLRPGDLLTVWGYTSFWKSHLMDWWALQEVKRIIARGNTNDIVIKVTWEQSVEEDTLSWLASASEIPVSKMMHGSLDTEEWKTLEDATLSRQVTPLWLMGHSLMESLQLHRPRPRMTLSEVAECIRIVVNEIAGVRLNPRLIILDYLQRIPPERDNRDSRREYVMENVNLSKDLGIAYGCPVVLGVQVGRQVLDRAEAMPILSDAQESSAIEQTSDKVLGLWYPIKTRRGGMVDNISVTPRMLIMELLKQKLGVAPISWILDIDPEKGTVEGARERAYTVAASQKKYSA